MYVSDAANAIFTGTVTIGLAPHAMRVDSWEFSDGKANFKLVVTQDTCTPVIEASYGNVYGGQ